jgi:uncharacterized protein (TIGR02145 family)
MKSVYDPCPSGWRVPANLSANDAGSPWKGFTDKNGGTFSGGYSWNANAKYPAAGSRQDKDGMFDGSAGSEGSYWSASPEAGGNNALYLYFYNGFVDIAYTSGRAYGYSVRCVKE